MTRLQTLVLCTAIAVMFTPIVIFVWAVSILGDDIKRQRCLRDETPRPYYCPATPAATESPKP